VSSTFQRTLRLIIASASEAILEEHRALADCWIASSFLSSQ
jgi:hypothetical protein